MLGIQIRKFLDEHQLDIKALAVKIGVKDAVFLPMLQGEADMPAEVYFLVCREIGVDLDFFLLIPNREPAESNRFCSI